jgi:hypothetical protein
MQGALRVNRRFLHRLRRLTGREWRDLLRAKATLIYVQILVRILPRGRMIGKSHQTPLPDGAPATHLPHRIRELAIAVSRAARHGLLRPSCLVRAIALHRLIEAHGYAGSRVRVGVHWSGNRFDAHAWVDYMGIIVGDDPLHVARFEEIAPLEFTNHG